MELGFLPHPNCCLLREIDTMMSLRRLDVLESICDCCIYRRFEFILARECRSCSVRAGMLELMDVDVRKCA
jgi:hypothetical protein